MVYNLLMKILIAPFIARPKAGSAYHITRTLSDLFSQRQHAIAVSASPKNSIASASLFEAAVPKKPLFFLHDQYSYEEWLYGWGASSEEYLEQDIACIEEAITQFRPDLIIVIDRIAALIAARKRKIPSLCIVNTSMYRNSAFPVKILQPANRILSAAGLEQVFRISDLYNYASERAVFGAIQLQPVPADIDVKRFGTVSYIKPLSEDPKDVYISFSAMHKKSTALKKMIIETFKGAPYQVNASIADTEAEKVQNIHFLSVHRDDLMRNAAAVIHDGSDYICDICCSCAIPQLIITDHNYGRTANALAARRYGFGVMCDENEMSVASLYENYRRLISSDRFRENAEMIRDEVISLGDFEDFYRFVLSQFRK